MKKRIITLITFFILISFTSCKTTYECLVCDDGSTPIVKALDAFYWKPVQSGIEIRDTETVMELSGQDKSKFFPEAYLLNAPESPHSAAKKDGVEIDVSKITLPDVKGNLIVEGAGGVLVPINEEETIMDIVKNLGIEVILVIPTYLGCINHSLLTINELKRNGVSISGIIFNGEESLEAQKIILEKSGVKKSLRIPRMKGNKSEFFDHWSFELSQIF